MFIFFSSEKNNFNFDSANFNFDHNIYIDNDVDTSRKQMTPVTLESVE